MRTLMLSIWLIVAASLSLAQTQVGTAMVDGRVVIIYSDKTWAFRDAADSDCAAVAKGVQFCDASGAWERARNTDPDIAAQFRYDDKHYGQYIVEELGLSDGFTMELMRQFIIDNAAGFAGIDSSEVIVHSATEHEFHGLNANTITIQVKVNMMDVIFINTIVLGDSRTMQITTFSINSSPTEKHNSIHEEFLEATELS